MFRLSQLVGAKLRENNADIADLSDMNRPTKLAEQYSELYDNEWTDAFEVLTNEKGKDELHTIVLLLIFVTVGFRNANYQEQHLMHIFMSFIVPPCNIRLRC